MADYCSNFCSNLYKSKYCQHSTAAFLDSLHNVTQVSQNDKALCDEDVTTEEISYATEHLKVNKSPGADALTAEFYQAFSKHLAPLKFS